MGYPRTVVFAYSEIGYRCLECLIQQGAAIVAVFTHADDPKESIWFPSVANLAIRQDITTYTPTSLKGAEIAELWKTIRPDLVLSFYYRHLIPSVFLKDIPLGAYNMHGSLLPKYRGCAPVNWAIINGETATGATLHTMVARADAGDIVDQEAVAIGPNDTAQQVTQRVGSSAIQILQRQWQALCQGKAPRIPQDESQATHFPRRCPEDGRIDWHWPTKRIYNLIRAVTRPYPGAFTDFENRGRLVIWWAKEYIPTKKFPLAPGTWLQESPLVIATGDGFLEITDAEWLK